MTSAKQEILERVRRSIADRAADGATGYRSIRRDYRQAGDLSATQRTELFVERIEDYGCAVSICAESEMPATLGFLLTERSKKNLLATADIPAAWLPSSFVFRRDEDLSYAELDAAEGVVTRCALAIADTGTIVLRHSSGAGRRALTLIPDYHLCLLFERQIVETVPEAIRQMSSFGADALTTISGPSATADIEMTRVKGVHGPRTLDVILVRSL